MRIHSVFFCALLAFATFAFGQAPHTDEKEQVTAKPPLDVKVEHFEVTDAIMRAGLSELSLKDIKDLHLGFEEIIRDKIQDDPRVQSRVPETNGETRGGEPGDGE